MSDYETGHGRPPKHTRFKPGDRANPKGRPKRRPPATAEIVTAVLNAPASYLERGRARTATRLELSLRTLMKEAVNGNVRSAEMLLKIRTHAQKFGDVGITRIQIHDWLPDYPGQTAEQKTRELKAESGRSSDATADPPADNSAPDSE